MVKLRFGLCCWLLAAVAIAAGADASLSWKFHAEILIRRCVRVWRAYLERVGGVFVSVASRHATHTLCDALMTDSPCSRREPCIDHVEQCYIDVARRSGAALVALPAIERRIKLYSQRGSLSANLVKLFATTLPAVRMPTLCAVRGRRPLG